MSATLVTCLFDLEGREGTVRPRSAEQYLELGEFLFRQSQPLICFADPSLADAVLRRRTAHGLQDQTRVVRVPLEELPRFSLVKLILGARRQNPILNLDPTKDTPLYTFVGWSKSFMLQEATTENPFETTHFVWIDIGIGYVAVTNHVQEDEVLSRPSDRVRLFMLRNWSSSELNDRAEYFRYRRGHVAGGLITGARNAVAEFCRSFDQELESALAAGFAPLDEQLIPFAAERSPERIEFHYGDYDHILENYRFLRGSADHLLKQMRWCRDSKDFRRGLEIGRRIIESQRLAKLTCSPVVLSALLDEAFVASYYADFPDQSGAIEIAKYYVELTRRDEAFLRAFRESEEHIRSNFGYLRESVW